MDQKIDNYLKRLEQQNLKGGYWNISRETGQYLYQQIEKYKPQLIVEIGSSNGYSTIWLALAAKKVGAKVLTYEFVPDKVKELVENLQKTKLIDVVNIIPDNANLRLAEIEQTIDFVFLDGRKNEYLDQLKMLEPKLSKKAIIIADNAISHKHNLQEYLYYVNNNNKLYQSSLKDIGTGLAITKRK